MREQFPGADREQLFLDWDIHSKSEGRKEQLVRKLWSQQALERRGMKCNAEFVLRLDGCEDAAEGMLDVVLGKTVGEGLRRSVVTAGSALVGSALQRMRSSNGSHKQDGAHRPSPHRRSMSSGIASGGPPAAAGAAASTASGVFSALRRTSIGSLGGGSRQSSPR